MRRALGALALPLTLFAVGCGGKHHTTSSATTSTTTTSTTTPLHKAGELYQGHRLSAAQAKVVCNVPVGKGSPDACAPPAIKALALHSNSKALQLGGSNAITFPDRSNNNAVGLSGMRAIARAGHPAIWLKGIEGLSFVDSTAGPMANYAYHYHMAVGLYDFVRTYSAAEANKIVAQASSLGLCNGRNQLPVDLDIEAGYATRSGVQTMVNVIRQRCGRVAIYTGGWYWGPFLGNWFPTGVSYWVSGYPSLAGWAGPVHVHQFTSNGFDGAGYGDLSVWLGSRTAFTSYIHSSSKPKPHHRNKAADRRHLRQLYAQRQQVRVHWTAINKEITFLRSVTR